MRNKHKQSVRILDSFIFILSFLTLPWWAYGTGTQMSLDAIGPFFLNSSLPLTWSNNKSIYSNVTYQDGLLMRLIQVSPSNPRFACGFLCIGTCTSYLFSVIMFEEYLGKTDRQPGFQNTIWSANRDNPVRENATLKLSEEGGLVLHDSDGTKVWSTDIIGGPVAGMNISEAGNLVLFNDKYGTVWKSFDHPTDTLVPGQELFGDRRLTASVSPANSSRGSYYALVNRHGFTAFVEAGTPLMYYQFAVNQSGEHMVNGNFYADFPRGYLKIYLEKYDPYIRVYSAYYRKEPHLEFLRLDSNGHLRVYHWKNLEAWTAVADIVAEGVDVCQYPNSCGDYGVCREGQCSCPEGSDGLQHFIPREAQYSGRGCKRVVPLSCHDSSDQHQLVEFGNLSHFNLIDSDAAAAGLKDLGGCKQACLKNCSCEAVFFKHTSNTSNGDCYLLSRVLSIRGQPIPGYNFTASAFIKVQKPLKKRAANSTVTTVAVGIGLTFVIITLLLTALCVRFFGKKKTGKGEHLKQVPGVPVPFSYKDLCVATMDFREKLGSGGFGSVFKGSLENGTKIAVKRLDNIGQGMKEFLAEVETIGSIHHINLVRLIGFCAENSCRLLVFEYMSNGSLDNWIYHKNRKSVLDWQTRKKIILDIAKGLTYLHEDCRQRILHLDIKPQNILLDDNFNAKVSDFGLSKFIDRDQSQLFATMRGTFGYLAPEWRQMRVTVKVDTYSFGIVILEIVCGRKNLDCSQQDSDSCLLRRLEKKAEENKLIDMIDQMSEDMQCNGEDAVRMLQIAAWCLQADHRRRPLMSVVVKALEGLMEVEPTISYKFSNFMELPLMDDNCVSSQPQASVLSGPR